MLLLLQRLSRILCLEVKTSNAIEWIKDNDMIANQNKFKAIVLTKTDHNTAGIRLEFSGKTSNEIDLLGAMKLTSNEIDLLGAMKLTSNEIDLLGVTIDTNSHITKICHKAYTDNLMPGNVSAFIFHLTHVKF